MNNEPTLFDKTPLIHKDDHFTEEQKRKSRKSAESQEARIVEYLHRRDRFSAFTAYELWEALDNGNEPLTSFRRALTNLATQGRVTKLSETHTGYYGKQEHLWGLNVDES